MLTCILRDHENCQDCYFSFVSGGQGTPLEFNTLYEAIKTASSSDSQFMLVKSDKSEHDFSVKLGANFISEIFPKRPYVIREVTYIDDGRHTVTMKFTFDGDVVHLDRINDGGSFYVN